MKAILNYSQCTIGAKRDSIKGFSAASRLRMLKTIARIDWAATGKCVFVTLTYPDEYLNRSYKKRTQDRNVWIRYIEKHLAKKAAVLWRIEWKPRKSGPNKGKIACHQHLFIFNVRYIDKAVVRKAWRKTLKRTGPLVTWIDKVDSGRMAAFYCTKYCGKKQAESVLDNAAYLNSHGRAWNLTRRKLVPFHSRTVFRRLSKASVARAMMVAAKMLGRHYLGAFTVFSQIAKVIAEEIVPTMKKSG